LLFGAAIYVVMNYVIVPLSAAPKFGSTTASTIGQIVVHLFLIGLPIALITRRVAPK
jgi:hypothetical protein